MTTRPRYRIYGLAITSDLPLPAPEADGGSPADVEVDWQGERPIPRSRPDGRLLAEISSEDEGAAWVESADGVIGRFFGAAEFRIDRDVRRIEVAADPACGAAMAGVLLAGSALGFALLLRGDCVLHASAVEHEGAVVAFTGASGMGKSTLAALACAAGARLVTDDVLRVDRDGGRLVCRGGATEIRLRPDAAGLAVPLDGVPRSTAADGRVIFRPTVHPDASELRAIAIPQADRSASTLVIEPLTPADALEELIRYPRVLGIRDVGLLRAQFRHAAEIVRRVPVVRAKVPWGPPFRHELGTELLERVGR